MYKMKLDTNANRQAFQRMDPASCDSTKYMWMNPMEMDANSDNIMYWAEGNRLWRNNNLSSISYNSSHQKSDFGWESFSDTLFPTWRLSVLSSSISPAHILYCGTPIKRLYRIDDSHVGDPSLVPLANFSTEAGSYCTDIAINPINADEILVVFSNYGSYSLYHSIDGGQSWDKAAGNLEQNDNGSGSGPSCRDAEIIPLGNDTLYLVGTTVGLFGTSKLEGINTVWEQIGSSVFGSTVVEYITYRQSDGLLVIGTYGNGVYQINLTGIGDVLDTDDIKNDKINLMAFPNPVVDNLSLVLNVDKNADSRIVIYDELGRQVEKENVQRLYSGENIIEIDFSNYRSGIYFISMTIDGKMVVKQIIKE